MIESRILAVAASALLKLKASFRSFNKDFQLTNYILPLLDMEILEMGNENWTSK